MVRKLDCIAKKVDDYLTQAHRIPTEWIRQPWVDVFDQAKVFCPSGLRLHANCFPDDLSWRKVSIFEDHAIGLDARNIEDVVNDIQQVLGGIQALG
jgi:hypothetical protein